MKKIKLNYKEAEVHAIIEVLNKELNKLGYRSPIQYFFYQMPPFTSIEKLITYYLWIKDDSMLDDKKVKGALLEYII